jgi:hypothetical protein
MDLGGILAPKIPLPEVLSIPTTPPCPIQGIMPVMMKTRDTHQLLLENLTVLLLKSSKTKSDLGKWNRILSI